jgi:hypothetical protein
MLKRFVLSGMAVVFVSAALAAQAPATGQTPTPSDRPATPSTAPASPSGQQPSAAATTGSSITLSGCLVREQDVPGRKPNVAERAGVLEDYILTSATAAASGGAAPGSSAKISSMYKVEGIADEKLKSLVGKKVEVTGRVDADDAREAVGTAGAATPKTADDDMPEFEATAIKEVPGECPAAK